MVKCYQKDYPRPQFVRSAWENLNGTWTFAFDDEHVGSTNGWNGGFASDLTINVPFSYETKQSGIGDETVHDTVWYQRTITVSKESLGTDHSMLHFEGSDYRTNVWLNGVHIGMHEGGYARFSFDVTDAVRDGNNLLVVKVEDSLDDGQPRGKQRWIHENFACWYVQTTGIWKTVWMEQVPAQHITSVKMTPNTAARNVSIEAQIDTNGAQDLWLEAVVTFGELLINKVRIPVLQNLVHTTIDLYNTATTESWGAFLWDPYHPNLYDISFRLLSDNTAVDCVGSYFGLRDVRIEDGNVLLNGGPLYQRLILDQGYWKDSHMTPPDEEALIEDIDKIMALGYNGVRKHQKIEDERFLYWCDVKGLLVWSEMAAAYRFHDDAVQSFTAQWMEIVRQNYNHPSIITWTPFNESWGIQAVETDRTQQHFTEAIYHLTKSFDPMRPVIVNDGWEHTISDIITLHDYEAEGEIFFDRYSNHKDEILSGNVFLGAFKSAIANGFSYQGQPIIISEFGGIAFKNGQQGWGYGEKVENEEAFIDRFDRITTAIKKLPYVCGYCYTQVSDVQQEINGLMDEERNFKVDPERIKEINTRRVISTR